MQVKALSPFLTTHAQYAHAAGSQMETCRADRAPLVRACEPRLWQSDYLIRREELATWQTRKPLNRGTMESVGTPTDLSPAAVAAISETLRQLLADVFALYLK